MYSIKINRKKISFLGNGTIKIYICSHKLLTWRRNRHVWQWLTIRSLLFRWPNTDTILSMPRFWEFPIAVISRKATGLLSTPETALPLYRRSKVTICDRRWRRDWGSRVWAFTVAVIDDHKIRVVYNSRPETTWDVINYFVQNFWCKYERIYKSTIYFINKSSIRLPIWIFTGLSRRFVVFSI